MLVHPASPGFNVLHNNGTPYGKRHFVIVSEARFIIDRDLQKKSLATQDRLLIHAWCAGIVAAAQFGTIPSEQQYGGWSEVSYNPRRGTEFIRQGKPVEPTEVFPVAVCTTYKGREVVLVPPG